MCGCQCHRRDKFSGTCSLCDCWSTTDATVTSEPLMVMIPRDQAKELARRLRMDFCNPAHDARCDCSASTAADLLDPKPPTLREKLLRLPKYPLTPNEADAVLIVIADDLKRMPIDDDPIASRMAILDRLRGRS